MIFYLNILLIFFPSSDDFDEEEAYENIKITPKKRERKASSTDPSPVTKKEKKKMKLKEKAKKSPQKQMVLVASFFIPV